MQCLRSELFILCQAIFYNHTWTFLPRFLKTFISYCWKLNALQLNSSFPMYFNWHIQIFYFFINSSFLFFILIKSVNSVTERLWTFPSISTIHFSAILKSTCSITPRFRIIPRSSRNHWPPRRSAPMAGQSKSWRSSSTQQLWTAMTESRTWFVASRQKRGIFYFLYKWTKSLKMSARFCFVEFFGGRFIETSLRLWRKGSFSNMSETGSSAASCKKQQRK